MHDPKIGDIWKWTWEVSGSCTYVLLTEDTGEQYFLGIDLGTGASDLWEFGVGIDEGWTFIA
jgi:hypothetical protein